MIHPSSIVEEGAQLGDEVEVWHFSLVRAGAVIHDRVRIGHHVYIDNQVTIGAGSKVKDGAKLFGELTIARDCFIGPNVTITNDRHPRANDENYPRVHTHIYSGASIGANSVILPGVSIGRHSMCGAGSIILTDVPPGKTVIGVWKG